MSKQTSVERICAGMRLALGCLGALFLSGCDRIAFDPSPARLQGEWTVNQGSDCEVPRGVPVLAKVQVRNTYRWRVQLPADAVPALGGLEEAVWKALRALPPSLASGAEAEAWWLLEGDLPAGRYEVRFAPEVPISAVGGVVVIRDEPVPEPLRLAQRAAVAKLSGTAADLATELQNEAEKEMLPTTRLVLSELLGEAGDEPAAALQLERFAEEIYGAEGLPSWLQLRMKACVKARPDSP